MTTSKHVAGKIAAQADARLAHIWSLRKSGATHKVIALHLGVGESRARKLVKKAEARHAVVTRLQA